MWLLDKMLKKLIKKGELSVTKHDGKEYRYGAPDPDHGPIRARLTDKGAAWHSPGIRASAPARPIWTSASSSSRRATFATSSS